MTTKKTKLRPKPKSCCLGVGLTTRPRHRRTVSKAVSRHHTVSRRDLTSFTALKGPIITLFDTE